MTFQQMSDIVDDLMDKAGNPWFTAEEKDRLLNMAQDAWLDETYEKFELNEMIREELNILVKSTTLGASDTVNLTAITDLKYVLSVSGVITQTDIYGAQTQLETVIQPRAIDKFEKNIDNSFNKPTSDYPVYEQSNNGNNILKIYAGGVTPTSVTLFYLRKPNEIDIANNPGSSSDFTDSVCRKIIQFGMERDMDIIESPRFQSQFPINSQIK